MRAAAMLKFAREEAETRDADGAASVMPTLLVGEREHRLYPLNPEKIDYIESDGNYVSIRSGSAAYISRDSIKRLAGELKDFGFIRIERSLLVNVRAVLYAETVGRGRFAFTLSSGACLQSSAGYRNSILRALPLASSPTHGAETAGR
jgi:DNA-binding LytR/AlgR family response regulator